ncbi:hypothetical protein [Flexibacterium corallicola]|uniref:hypothetical protein n=1 Tax=Flexibacterium corallicola TaxID=3037259 RepID=UPI00286F9C9F|nr:hypothetical protein [Pseudovibrio sp. M1P-2-3]
MTAGMLTVMITGMSAIMVGLNLAQGASFLPLWWEGIKKVAPFAIILGVCASTFLDWIIDRYLIECGSQGR